MGVLFAIYLMGSYRLSFRMNLNYLLRDELDYEPVIRGVNLAGDFQLLPRLCNGGGHSCYPGKRSLFGNCRTLEFEWD
jgi:hypothetical protein